MKRFSLIVISISLILSFAAGCSPNYNLASFGGVNISDLEAAKPQGKSRLFNASYDYLYDRVLQIVKNNKLYIFRQSKPKGYIVVMDFKKQVNTTRVGIFFDSINESTTKITITSLSPTALPKATGMIFGELTKE